MAPSGSIIDGKCRWHGQVDSTMLLVRELHHTYGLAGQLHVAKEQTAGRGRRGATWDSPPGSGFYGSVLLNQPQLLRHVGLLPFAGALAAAGALRSFAPEAALSLKWPNDVLAQGRKLGGILVEASSAKGDTEYAVLGIGLNLTHAPANLPGELAFPATSFQQATGTSLSPQALGEVMPGWLDQTLGLIAGNCLDEFWGRYRALWHDQGRAVTIRGNEGALRGVVGNVTEDGALILETDDTTTVVRTGTLRYEETDHGRSEEEDH